jgi:hypothetical protein
MLHPVLDILIAFAIASNQAPAQADEFVLVRVPRCVLVAGPVVQLNELHQLLDDEVETPDEHEDEVPDDPGDGITQDRPTAPDDSAARGPNWLSLPLLDLVPERLDDHSLHAGCSCLSSLCRLLI